MTLDERLDELLQIAPDALTIGSHAVGHALKGDVKACCHCVEAAMGDTYLLHGEHGLWSGSYKMILRTYPVLGVAYAYDLMQEEWDPSFRDRVRQELLLKGTELLQGGGEGWNSNSWSNWTGITAGTAGVCGLVLGDENLVTRSEERVLSYLKSLGETGWSNEGFNYVRFAMARGVLPFAWKRGFTGTVANRIAELYAQWTLPGTRTQVYGAGVPIWEQSIFRSGDRILAWLLADPAGRARLSSAQPHLLEEDLVHPQDLLYARAMVQEGEVAPAPVPSAWIDRTKAVVQFRNPEGWVASMSGNRNARRGAHSHRDAGSFRISRGGVDWIAKAPSGKGRWRENVLDLEGCEGWHGGAVTHFSESRATLYLDPVCLQTPAEGDRWDDAEDAGTRWTRSLEMRPGVIEVTDQCSEPAVWRVHAMVDSVEVLPEGFRLQKDGEELVVHLGKVPLRAARQEGVPKGADGVLHEPVTWWVLEADVEGEVHARFLTSDEHPTDVTPGEQRLQPGEDIQAAIDAVCEQGGGTVTLLPGEHPVGDLQLRSHLDLVLEESAVLIASEDPADYPGFPKPGEGHHRARTLWARDAENITIRGKGEIRGIGPDRYDPWGIFTEVTGMLPFRVGAMKFDHCRNLLVQGVKVTQTDFWTLVFEDCEFVHLDQVVIENQRERFHNDGIDLCSCRNAVVSRCSVFTGDDAICVKSMDGIDCVGVDIWFNEVASMTCGMKIGTELDGDVRDTNWSWNRVTRSPVGFGIYDKDGFTVEGVRVESCSLETEAAPFRPQAGFPLMIDVERRTPDSPLGAIHDLSFRNLECLSDGNVLMRADEGASLSKVTLTGITHTLLPDGIFEPRRKPGGTHERERDPELDAVVNLPGHAVFQRVQDLHIDGYEDPTQAVQIRTDL